MPLPPRPGRRTGVTCSATDALSMILDGVAPVPRQRDFGTIRQGHRSGAPGSTPRRSVDLPGRKDHAWHRRFTGRLLIDEANARRRARDHGIDLVAFLVLADALRDHDRGELGGRDQLFAV